ncbi:hypothetical protein T06_8322 [Trichinella sp. T6]|nr:hypothetical protein T06_8322 [Trichinella sp. T6]
MRISMSRLSKKPIFHRFNICFRLFIDDTTKLIIQNLDALYNIEKNNNLQTIISIKEFSFFEKS